jgi:ribose transport system permease protein
LVPLIARHIGFITPFGAFAVLAAVVGSVMLYSATHEAYVLAADAAPEIPAGPVDRYRLLPVADGAGLDVAAPTLSPLQQAAFATAAAAVAMAFTFRMIASEAISMRFGAFLYLFIGAMILSLLLLSAGSGRAEAPPPAAVGSAVP